MKWRKKGEKQAKKPEVLAVQTCLLYTSQSLCRHSSHGMNSSTLERFMNGLSKDDGWRHKDWCIHF